MINLLCDETRRIFYDTLTKAKRKRYVESSDQSCRNIDWGFKSEM